MTCLGMWLDWATGGRVGRLRTGVRRMATAAGEESGQGTTEYAVLLGVLVIIAIFAIIVLRDPITNLWQGIIDNMETINETATNNPFG